jgi:predicted ATPase/DNA-binding CsgD family transcriptional regulator
LGYLFWVPSRCGQGSRTGGYNSRADAQSGYGKVAMTEETNPTLAPGDVPSGPSELGPRPGSLPLELSSFVGREREMKKVEELLANQRLLTLTGPGGSGKTRLALAVASQVARGFEDGAWLVELAPLSDPDLVPQAVASVLGVRESPGTMLADALVEHLRTRSSLLLLDNCEHLLEASASLADNLLRRCPKLRIVATSRAALGVAGETLFDVPPLSLPDPRRGPTVGSLPGYEAVRLFVERAGAVRAGFSLTEENAPAVARVCYRLDGIPLALELAAARTKVLSVDQISERLDDSFSLLTGGGRTAMSRHRTLRAAMDWSYDLLAEEEQTLLGRLSVFAGGFTLEAAEAVGAGGSIDEEEVIDLLSSLVDKSLVLVSEQNGEARYRLLETVRQYGREKLGESGEEAVVEEYRAGYYLTLAEEAEAGLQGPDQVSWLRRLEKENDNFRAVLAWSLDPEGERDRERAEMSLRIAVALSLFWNISGSSEGYRWTRAALEASGERSLLRAKALNAAAWMALWSGDYERAIASLEEGRGLFREMGDNDNAAMSVAYLGMTVLRQADEERIAAMQAEAESLRREPLESRALAELLFFLGAVSVHKMDVERGVELFEGSLVLFRELEDPRGISRCIVSLGVVFVMGRDYRRAAEVLIEGLESVREVGDKPGTNFALLTAAALAAHQGDAERAARLWGAAEALREEIGLSMGHQDRVSYNYEERVAAARARLDEATWEKAWAEGRAMSAEQAIDYALEYQATLQEEPSSPADYPAGLSAREVEVLRLAANGLTNAQIAKELYISPRTVNAHMGSVYHKIGSSTRAEAARFASEHGLL